MTDSTRASATDATHPRFNSRAYGRFRFDGNREVLTKRDGRVASTHERRRCSAECEIATVTAATGILPIESKCCVSRAWLVALSGATGALQQLN